MRVRVGQERKERKEGGREGGREEGRLEWEEGVHTRETFVNEPSACLGAGGGGGAAAGFVPTPGFAAAPGFPATPALPATGLAAAPALGAAAGLARGAALDGEGFAAAAGPLAPILPTADEAADLAAPAIALETPGLAAAEAAAAGGAGGAGGGGRDGTMVDSDETSDVSGSEMRGVAGPLSMIAETWAARATTSASTIPPPTQALCSSKSDEKSKINQSFLTSPRTFETC
jgi:hypothetical protein